MKSAQRRASHPRRVEDYDSGPARFSSQQDKLIKSHLYADDADVGLCV
jgi:hypothetical protein